MSKPYIILRATTLEALEQAVAGHMAAGYAPVGGPVNATAFSPPFNTIAQAMVHREGAAAVHSSGRRELGPAPESVPSMGHKRGTGSKKANVS